jgi:hypothetical protein
MFNTSQNEFLLAKAASNLQLRMGQAVDFYPIPSEEEIKELEFKSNEKEKYILQNNDLETADQGEDREKEVSGIPYVELKIMFMPSQGLMRKILRAISYFSADSKYTTEDDEWLENFGFKVWK